MKQRSNKNKIQRLAQLKNTTYNEIKKAVSMGAMVANVSFSTALNSLLRVEENKLTGK